MAEKLVYSFGGGTADGRVHMKNLLGGKGANLAEMARLGIPVPPGFTITTAVCTAYYANKRKYPAGLKEQVATALRKMERIMKARFGDPANPLLVSSRSGARQSMPGMMETVLNVGLTTKTIPGLIAKSGDTRFVYDAYRRLITMYSDVVMEKAAGREPAEGEGVRHRLEEALEEKKRERGVTLDTGGGVYEIGHNKGCTHAVVSSGIDVARRRRAANDAVTNGIRSAASGDSGHCRSLRRPAG